MDFQFKIDGEFTENYSESGTYELGPTSMSSWTNNVTGSDRYKEKQTHKHVNDTDQNSTGLLCQCQGHICAQIKDAISNILKYTIRWTIA